MSNVIIKLLFNFINISMVPKVITASTMVENAMLNMNKLLKKIINNPSGARHKSTTVNQTKLTANFPRQLAQDSSPESTLEVYRLETQPKVSTDISKEEALKYITEMKRIRQMERLAQALYLQRKIRGFCHLYIGEEACAVGIKAAMGTNDTIITTYRCHGWALLMGEKMENILGELLGKINGSSRGKGGSMHIYGNNFFGGNGIVGAHVPLGTGIALAHKYRKNGAVSWTIYGDGAADQGQTFESFNMAKLWNLPVVYVIENNQYSMGTATKRHSANTKYFTKGDIIPGIRVNGMDLLAIREAGRFAAKHVKEEKGPIILQLDTYRFRGHSMSDPGTSYRTKEEVDKVRESNDCIKNFVQRTADLVTKEELASIEDSIKKEVKKVKEECSKVKEPGLEELQCDIYKEYKDKVKFPQMLTFKEHKNVSHLVYCQEVEIGPIHICHRPELHVLL